MDIPAGSDPSLPVIDLGAASGGSIETDAVVIGAGPVGLFQVFELGILDIKAHVVDSLSSIGGQCSELYADKPIYDIPALPYCTGSELVQRLLKQIEPFKPAFHLGQTVTSLERRSDERFNLETSSGKQFIARTIFIAAGVGSFQPRRLQVEGIDAFEGSQVFYRVQNPARFYRKDLVIYGNGSAAIDWAIHFADKARSVMLLHRRDDLHAAPESLADLRAHCENSAIQLSTGQLTGFVNRNGRMAEIHVRRAEGEVNSVPLDDLLVLYGLSPKLGPIADWNLSMERQQLMVDTEQFETSVPRIFAVGDVNTYPGKRKLILCGFHEATLAAFGAARYVFPMKKIHLQYTTTSPKIHKLLGV